MHLHTRTQVGTSLRSDVCPPPTHTHTQQSTHSYLSPSPLFSSVCHRQSSKDNEAVEKVMNDLDANNDGEVDFTEFIILMGALTVACNDFFLDVKSDEKPKGEGDTSKKD